MVSSQRNEIKSTETPGISQDDKENIEEIEVVDTEETIEDEVNENQEEKILEE
jgi:acetylglutamate kinase